jgi:hypothetical protein
MARPPSSTVCDAVFVYDPEVENKRTAGLNTIDDVIEFYNREYSKRIQRLRSIPGEKLAKEVDFFGVTKGPSISFLGSLHLSGHQVWRFHYDKPTIRHILGNPARGLTGSADHTTDGVIRTRPLPSKAHSRANDTTLTTD